MARPNDHKIICKKLYYIRILLNQESCESDDEIGEMNDEESIFALRSSLDR